MSSASIEELLKRREQMAFSPVRVARVDRELARLGYKPEEAKAARAEVKETAERAIPAKRTYTKRK